MTQITEGLMLYIIFIDVLKMNYRNVTIIMYILFQLSESNHM